MYSIDHSDNFDHMYYTKPAHLWSICNIMLKYQYLTEVVLNFT